MLALSLLLSAAAGVDAMLGSNIIAVTTSNTTHFCPEDCTFGGGFFQRVGNVCLDSQIVILSSPDFAEEPYACNGTSPKGWQEQPDDGLAPECDVYPSTPNDPDPCYSDRFGEGGRIVQWSELEKLIKSAS